MNEEWNFVNVNGSDKYLKEILVISNGWKRQGRVTPRKDTRHKEYT